MSAPTAPKAHPRRTRCACTSGAPTAPNAPPYVVGGVRGCAARVRSQGAHDPAALADELAARVSRLTVSRRDPHLFHEEKSEIANSLGELAHELHAQKG